MPTLTRAEAAQRSALLTVHSYRVALDTDRGPDTFRVVCEADFSAARPGAATFVDLQPGELHSAVLNGQPVDVSALAGGRLPLAGLAERNKLVITADMCYSHESVGLHRFTDPADGQTYLYGHSAPDAAPRIFPCFDQPDLKARLSLSVTAPEDWLVLGTGAAARTGPGQWELATTPPLPPYLATVVAGPYRSLTAEHDGIPLGLHCRASLFGSLQPDGGEMFEIIRRCLDEYHRLFAVRYPFGKYDQVFVPEFGSLAMENPGCVLIRDQRLFRGAVSGQDREDRAVIIAHEMSHMWFGNLVTMRWWDDLWLNEAFADYMGHRVPTEATAFTGALTSFAAGRKTLGYVADQRPSTHPLSADAPDVATGLTHFDHISYFKGSAVIRQLATMLGDEALTAGLRRYFERHAYGNADYADFLAALSGSGESDLADWGRQWLREANVNTLAPEITVTGGRITAAAVRQTAPGSHPVLRSHTFNIGLYGPGQAVVTVTADGARTELPQLTGREAPAFVLLNDGDLTYAKIRFDQRSRLALPGVLADLPPVNRAMVWSALLLAVRDAAIPAAEYLALATTALATERELPILSEVLQQARAEVAGRFLSPAARPAALAGLAGLCRELLARTPPGDHRRLVVYRALIDCTCDPGELRNWLGEAGLPAGITLDPELAWLIRYRLAVLGDLAEAEIEAAHQHDRSAQGDLFGAKCRAARPDPEAKRRAWESIAGDAQLSNYGVWALAEGFWQPEQAGLAEPYAERFFTDLPGICKLRDEQVLGRLTELLYPRYSPAPATLRRATESLELTELPVAVLRKLIDCTDDLRRAAAAREL